MPKILCTLPNASEEISGVKFTSHEKGMLSEDISAEAAEAFAGIPGYEVVGAAKPVAPQKPAEKTAEEIEAEAAAKEAADAKAAEEASERAELLKRAEAVEGFKVKQSWGNERLRTEVEQAEKALADAKAAAAKTE